MTPTTADDDRERLAGPSRAMAAGTVASRVTGMLRDIAVVAAVGLGVFGDTYSVANTVPNIIYILIIGGALNAIFVPQLVRAMAKDSDGGIEFTNRLLTAATILLVAVAGLATLAAPWIITLYSTKSWSPQDEQAAVLFARFCLPQIALYGLAAMFAQVLNARNGFAAPMFAPIANNVVVTATALVFIRLVGTNGVSTNTVSDHQIALLGLGTTLGVLAQTGVVWLALRRSGFRWRWRFGLRETGLGKVGTLASWTVVFVLTNQFVLIFITRLAAGANAVAQGIPGAASGGFTSYTKAYLLFILPHSVITVSLVTAMVPRMSRAVIGGDSPAVADDVGSTTRFALVALVPAAVALIVLGQPLAEMLFGFGNAPVQSARFIGTILGAFALGLPSFTVFYILLRGFYVLEDTRTPALVNIGMSAINLAAAIALFSAAPNSMKVPALAMGFSLSYLITVPFMWHILSRKMGGIPTASVRGTALRALAAALLAGAVALLTAHLIETLLGAGRTTSAAQVVIAGGLGLATYVVVGRWLRIRELVVIRRALVARRGFS